MKGLSYLLEQRLTFEALVAADNPYKTFES